MSTIAEEFSRIKALAEKAPRGPISHAGADFYNDARQSVPRLVAALELALDTIENAPANPVYFYMHRKAELLAILRGEKP